MDDCINSSGYIPPPFMHIFPLLKDTYIGWGFVLNCFVLSSLPLFPWLLIAIPTSSYIFFFFSSRCMLELKFDLSQNSKSVLIGFLSRCMVRVFKIDAAIRNDFPKCVCGATPPQTGRLLPRIGKFFPKNRKASSEERWVRTHISFRNAVQLRLRIFRVRV